ncbi:hypothetical protein F5I97DRAFT_1931484 [Phlebopus sp. FC_14]|nr:hypothetical protein F5I97DRAFT_1931484 [Phlebopus sp. FC_14]
MAATFPSNSSSFNPSVRPPSRTDRGGASGSSKGYVLPIPSGFSVRVFKAPTLSASSRQYSVAGQPSTKGDVDYRPSSHRDPRQSAPPARDGPRKLTKAAPPPPPAPEDYQSRGGRFGVIHAGPVPDTYIYERSIISSKSEGYYYPPSSDSTASDIDSIFSVNTQLSSASSNSSVDCESPPRGALALTRVTPERRPSYGQSPPRNQSAASFPPTYHTCPACSEMSNSPPTRSASRADSASHGSRPLPTPPVSARVRKDSLVLASERSGSTTSERPHLPPLRIGDRPTYHPGYDQSAQGGYPSSSPPQLTRSTSLKSSGSAGSNSHGTVSPPPGLNTTGRDYPQTAGDIGAEHGRRPQRRNSDGDQEKILPPRPARSNTEPPPRSVRWCENLEAPSPILPSQRRKGWFNRRGDQLWRNDGSYKPPPPGEGYPIDLDDYPEPSEGWQNEEGVRIDLNRRLIPRAPIRGVLKRTNYCPEDGIIAGYLTDFPSSPTSDDEE